MDWLFQTADISRVIQLAVAPVFLLAGISGALNVMSTRLGRIVDRGRQLHRQMEKADEKRMVRLKAETVILRHRAGLTNKAITLCTTSALFICLVIVALFIGALLELEVGVLIAFLFVVSIVCLIMSLILFLKEIGKSTMAFRFDTDDYLD